MTQGMAKTRDPDNDRIARNMKAFRTEVGMSVEQVFGFTGIPVDSLRRYEAGKSGVPGTVLAELARVYGRTMDDFNADRPGPADPSKRPGVALMQAPGVEVNAKKLAEVQKLLAEINSEIRPRKSRK